MQGSDTLMASLVTKSKHTMTWTYPDEVIDDLRTLVKDYDEIFGTMTKKGAKNIGEKLETNMPPTVRASKMYEKLDVSKVYHTKSDDAINTKELWAGYFVNKRGKLTPAPLVANMFEYGRNRGVHDVSPVGTSQKAARRNANAGKFSGDYPNLWRGFLKKSIVPDDIEKVMLEEQEKQLRKKLRTYQR